MPKAATSSRPKKLLAEGTSNAKLKKNSLRTLGLSLAPGSKEVCPFASRSCRKVCLTFAGRGAYSSVQVARANKLRWWKEDPEGFKQQLRKELRAALAKELKKHPRKKGPLLAVRLNVLSDIRWEVEAPELFMAFPRVQFYDYTKWPFEQRPSTTLPPNYHLTYSASEDTSLEEVQRNFAGGRNVAVVFEHTAVLPSRWWWRPVVDGDASDERWKDSASNGECPVVVGLSAKGRARKMPGTRDGFVKAVYPLRDGAWI